MAICFRCGVINYTWMVICKKLSPRRSGSRNGYGPAIIAKSMTPSDQMSAFDQVKVSVGTTVAGTDSARVWCHVVDFADWRQWERVALTWDVVFATL